MQTVTALEAVEIKNWKDLRDYLNAQSEESLMSPVCFWGEYEGKKLPSIAKLNEDFINPSGEGCEPVGVYRNDPEYGDNYVDGEDIVHAAGSLILQTDDMSFSIKYKGSTIVP